MPGLDKIGFRDDVTGTLKEVSAGHPLPVSVSGSDITVEIGPEVATSPTDHSGTITSGGTAQTAINANSTRVEAWTYNVDASEDLWVNFTGTAVVSGAGSVRLSPGRGWAGKVTSAVSVIAATTGHKFTAGER